MKYKARESSGYITSVYTTDSSDTSISRKKRVRDTMIIKSLLTVKSPLKLKLKEYRFLMKCQARDTMTSNQRMWLEVLFDNLTNIIRLSNI